MVQSLVGALARDLVVLAMDSRELERLEPMLEQNLGRLAVLVRAPLLTLQVRQIHGVLGHDQVQLQSSVACNQRERGFAHTLLFSVEGTPKAAPSSECFNQGRCLPQPLRLLPAGATVAGRDSHPLGKGALHGALFHMCCPDWFRISYLDT